MARNFYEVLGIPKTASDKEIQKAYRELARKFHPDLHPDDKDAAKKFSEVQQAFDTLNNKDKRKQYDQFGENYQQYQGMGGSGAGAGGFNGGSFNMNGQEFDLNDILGRFSPGAGGFGGFGGGRPRSGGGRFGGFDFDSMGGGPAGGFQRQSAPQKGQDIQSELSIPFALAVTGGQQMLSFKLSTGQIKELDVNIPAGISDGKKIRLRGQGGASPMGGTAGDLLITIHVLPHPCFTRQGNDLIVQLPITLSEAINGGKVDVPTPKGVVAMTIPPGTSSGKRLRIKGMGVKDNKGTCGDLYVEPKIILPDTITDQLGKAAEEAENRYSSNPRAELRW